MIKRLTLVFCVGLAGWMSIGFTGDTNDCATCPAFKKGFAYTKVEFLADGTPQGGTTVVVDSVWKGHDTLYTRSTITGTTASGQPANLRCMQWCANNNYSVDVLGTITGDSRAQNATFEISPLLYPLNVQKGDTLPGGYMQMVVQESWGASTVQAKWERRVCLGDDTVMVGGKVYNTKKMQTFCSIRLKKGPVTMGDVKYSITEWFSPGYGILKTESFNETKPVRNTRVISITEGEQ